MAIKDEIWYDPERGTFFWKRATRGRKRKIGTKTSSGYVHIRVNHTVYQAHQLAWYLTYDRWPKAIHHLNGIKHDNRLSNLVETDLHSHKTHHPSGLKRAARPASNRRRYLYGL